MRNNRKFIMLILFAALLSITCSCGEKNEIDESKKYEVDGVIFENDLMSIAGVSTEEYVEVFKTQKITYTYFAKDFKELKAANILSLGGTVISVTPGEEYLEELPCSVLSVFENGQETIITDKLEEFFICRDAAGNVAVYYETYHLYAESEDKDSINKYVTLKAYKVEFECYTSNTKVETI